MISIVIPVYNSARYLHRCIASVLEQDFHEIEIILVDDGSSDKSNEICDEYASKDKRIKVIHQSNQGASIARKNGLSIATGEYVSFVDSDDWIAKSYISTLYAMLVKHHVTVSACSVKRVKENEVVNTPESNLQSLLLPFAELMPRFFKYEFWGFPGKLYKRSTLNQITFPKATLSEDYYVMTQLFMKERQMAYTDESLYYYEYHEQSLSHQKLSKRAFEEFENVKAVYEIIKEKEPRYSSMAFANVVETCIKLCLMILHEDKNSLFQNEYKFIRSFLQNHVKEIVSCNYLSWKTRTIVLCHLICPHVTAMVI